MLERHLVARGGSMSAMKKQSLYFPEQMLREIVGQAGRMDRSISWVVQRAWMHARKVIMTGPSFPKDEEVPSTPGADAGRPAGE